MEQHNLKVVYNNSKRQKTIHCKQQLWNAWFTHFFPKNLFSTTFPWPPRIIFQNKIISLLLKNSMTMILVGFHDFPGLENSFLKFHDFPQKWTVGHTGSLHTWHYPTSDNFRLLPARTTKWFTWMSAKKILRICFCMVTDSSDWSVNSWVHIWWIRGRSNSIASFSDDRSSAFLYLCNSTLSLYQCHW